MGDQLGQLHFLLGKELTFLSSRWEEFKTIFASSEDEIKVLNGVAPAFFAEVQRQQWSGILLDLCKLTDPVKSGGRKNLTIEKLPNVVPTADLKVQTASLVSEAQAKTEFARDWRKRELAHKDLKRARDPQSYPLEKVNRQRIEEAREAIAEVLNRVDVAYQGSPTLYELPWSPLGGAGVLLRRLRQFLQLRSMKRRESMERDLRQKQLTEEAETLPEEDPRRKEMLAEAQDLLMRKVEDLRNGIY